MRDRLIELLTDNLPRCGNLPHWDNPLQLSCDEQVERIADHLLANGVTVQEWISVKDRLPENDQRVLCFNYNGEYKVLRWNYIDWMWNSGIEWLKEDYVLFWMPLPQPPKGE